MAVLTFSLGAIGIMHAHRLRHTDITVYDGDYWPRLDGVLSLQTGRDAVDRGSWRDRIDLTCTVKFHRYHAHEPLADTLDNLADGSTNNTCYCTDKWK